MAALTSAYEALQKPTIIVSYKVAAATTIYKGGLVAVNASGFLVPMNHSVASLKFVGIAEDTVANSGADGDLSCRVSKAGSGVFFNTNSATQADLGKEVYGKSDNEVNTSTVGLVNQYKVGTIVAVENTSLGQAGLRIKIDNYTV